MHMCDHMLKARMSSARSDAQVMCNCRRTGPCMCFYALSEPFGQACARKSMYAHMHACAHAHVHTHTHTRPRAQMHTHTHT